MAKYNIRDFAKSETGPVAPPYPSSNVLNGIKALQGPVAPPYPDGGIPDPKNRIPVRKLSGKFNRKSMLGQLLLMPVKFKIPKAGEEWYQLPNEPVMSIDFTNELVVTKLNRGKRRGNLVEMININNYRLSISGICINQDSNDYPEADISQFRKFIEYTGAIQIDSLITRLFNITFCTMEAGSIHRQPDTNFREAPYSLTLMSDEDFDLEQIK